MATKVMNLALEREAQQRQEISAEQPDLPVIESAGDAQAAEPRAAPPITVGNPLSASDFAIDQAHLEEFTTEGEGPPDVTCARPPRGTYFTVRAETGKPWQDRKFYFLLELKDRDPFIVAPKIAKEKKEEDVIRPVLMVRYVTMTGEEGLWALKIDPPDRKANSWNKSARAVLKVAEERWVRLISARGHYHHTVSPKTYEQTPPRYSDRTFDELVDIVFEDRVVTSLDHEIWDVLDTGSEK
jgi:hypothetical protein